MKAKDLKRYQQEEFNKIYPLLKKLLSKFQLSETITLFNFSEIEFLACNKDGVVEFSFSTERPIFPTLVFKPSDNGSAELLYFRFDMDLMKKLLYRFEILND